MNSTPRTFNASLICSSMLPGRQVASGEVEAETAVVDQVLKLLACARGGSPCVDAPLPIFSRCLGQRDGNEMSDGREQGKMVSW